MAKEWKVIAEPFNSYEYPSIQKNAYSGIHIYLRKGFKTIDIGNVISYHYKDETNVKFTEHLEIALAKAEEMKYNLNATLASYFPETKRNKGGDTMLKGIAIVAVAALIDLVDVPFVPFF